MSSNGKTKFGLSHCDVFRWIRIANSPLAKFLDKCHAHPISLRFDGFDVNFAHNGALSSTLYTIPAPSSTYWLTFDLLDIHGCLGGNLENSKWSL